MSNEAEQTNNLCQDCGGMNQVNERDISQHYCRETETIVFVCLDCQWNRVAPVDPEESAFYRYGQH